MKNRLLNYALQSIRPNRRLPDLIILGVQKGATSSIFHYLNQHPQIVGSNMKEIHFFDNEENYKKGLDWYKRQFPRVNNKSLLMEATPSYLYHEKVAQRIHKLGHPIKFIVSFRSPIERAFSAWNMYKKLIKLDYFKLLIKKQESKSNKLNSILSMNPFPSFRDMINLELDWIEHDEDVEEPSLLRRGFYEEQMNIWFKYFDRDHFLFLKMDDFIDNKLIIVNTIKEIYSFLGLKNSNTIVKTISMDKKNVGNYVSSLDFNLSQLELDKLKEMYRKKNQNLLSMTGIDYFN